jgi:Ca2+-binding EF-hand superfamily protein
VAFYWTLLARDLDQYFDQNGTKHAVDPQARPGRKFVLSAKEEEQMKEIFNLFDTDGDEKLEMQELKVAMTALGFQDARKHRRRRGQRKGGHGHSHRELFEAIDSDHSDHVTLDEFRALMTGEAVLSDPQEDVKAVFAELSRRIEGDSDRPNVITLGRLRAAAQKFNVRLSDEELKVMMTQVDTGGDQTVSEEEFMEIMQLSPWF